MNHLHCFFVVMNVNESVLIIGSKLNPFFCDDDWYKSVSLEVMHNRWYVHSFCRSSRDLAFLDKILQGVREEKLQLKDLWIFLKQTITWARDFLMFFIAYFILSESNSSAKIFSIFVETTSLLNRGIFSNVVICSLNTLTSIKTGSSYINTTEKT